MSRTLVPSTTLITCDFCGRNNRNTSGAKWKKDGQISVSQYQNNKILDACDTCFDKASDAIRGVISSLKGVYVLTD